LLHAVALLAGVALFAPLPKQSFSSVVAIGRMMPDGSKAWIGSGFLYAYVHRTDRQGENRYRGYIVTNRHVLAGLSEALVRFNPGSLSPETAAEVVKLPLLDAWGKTVMEQPPGGGGDRRRGRAVAAVAGCGQAAQTHELHHW
jgi:hypothetical protein